MNEFIVVSMAKFLCGDKDYTVLSRPLPQRDAEIEAAWLEHLMGWENGTTHVVRSEVVK